MLEILLRWWQQLYGKGVLCNLSLNGTCQFAKTFTPLKQQMYVQIIHAETKHAPVGSQLRQLPWSTWVIKYIFLESLIIPAAITNQYVSLIVFVCKERVFNLL